jgi:glycerophosphoryl diester phosphodiesterase
MRSRTLRLAHRGDARAARENTIPALVAALSIAGCDGLEFDVRTSRDRKSALLHDETLQRVFGRPDHVRDLTLQQLHDAGIPSLQEALAAVGSAPFIDIELKDGPAADFFGVVDYARGPALRNTVISSFDGGVLRIVRGQRPDWPVWLNTALLNEETVRAARALGCVGVSVEWHDIDEAWVDYARQVGLHVAAWTVRRRATYERLARIGVFAVCVEAAALDG